MQVPDYCPNIEVCRLVIVPDFTIDAEQRKSFIQTYCHSDTKKWESCKRLIVKNKLNFCPDFVLPDTELTPDEIIDKFDQDNLN